MNVGEISAPVKTDFGYHLIRMDDIKTGQQQAYDEMNMSLSLNIQDFLQKKNYLSWQIKWLI